MTSDKFTAEQVRDACLAAGIRRVDHHECGICGLMVRFYITADGDLEFDPSCGCTYGGNAEPRPWQDAADWINMQSDESHRRRIAEAFGIKEVA